jgi:hypothetical protein
MKNRFYMACLRDTVGTNTAFHCIDGGGYSTNISSAHIYTLQEAQLAWDKGRDFDQPMAADLVDSLSEWHVDCQVIPNESVFTPGCTCYVAFVKGDWDGNDVYWVTNRHGPVTNFLLAHHYDAPDESMDGVVWLPFNLADVCKRRTFRLTQFNPRSMVQGPGLKVPEHIKRSRRKSVSHGKTRWNCPGCGKISWQDSPYDFAGCRHFTCDEWRKEV